MKVKEITPSKEFTQQLGESVVKSFNLMLYKPHYSKVRTYCCRCGKESLISKEKFKQIQYSKMCPDCNRQMYVVEECKSGIKWLCSNVIVRKNGFWVEAKIEFGKPVKAEAFHSTYIDTKKVYVKNIRLSGMMCGQSIKKLNKEWYPNLWDKWKESRSYNYERLSIYHEKLCKEVIPTKKQYLNNYASFITKSNQIKLVQDNTFNPAQLKAIKIFDLKKPEEVYKYRVWIKKNEWTLSEATSPKDETYNVYTLHYLWKNKISFSDYKDYAKLCREIGRKPDKPKDFWLWHDRLAAVKEAKSNAKYQSGVKKQYKKLSKYNIAKSNYEIKTFESVEDICTVSKYLHNCMSRLYIEPFSKGKTELWCMYVDGKPTLAIEVNKGRLIQCRTDKNGTPTLDQKKTVNKWLKERCAVC